MEMGQEFLPRDPMQIEGKKGRIRSLHADIHPIRKVDAKDVDVDASLSFLFFLPSKGKDTIPFFHDGHAISLL
jgi:hypothetical protein